MDEFTTKIGKYTKCIAKMNFIAKKNKNIVSGSKIPVWGLKNYALGLKKPQS